MLSTGAFNALLKTLEEPPAHVKFILATTEPQKLPATILSRCQTFDFKKIPNEDIEKRLNFVCEQSNIKITQEALKLISILSEGAMRDALSILERCVQEGEGEIDEDRIKDLVGIPKLSMIYKIVKSIFEYNVENAILASNEILNSGKDINNLLWEMIKYIKDVLVYKVTGNLQIYSKEEIMQIKDLSELVTKDRLLQIIYDLSELENNMKWSSQKSILFQVEMIKLCSDININSKQDDKPKNVKPVNKPTKPVSKEKVEEKPKQTIKGDAVKNWNKIVDNLKNSGKILLYTNLINSQAVEINDMTVGIGFENGLTPFAKSVLEKPENINELSRLVSIECGKTMRIKIIDNVMVDNKNPKSENTIENIANDLDIPFNIIEEE